MNRSILIDASHWGQKEPTGVELYVDGLIPALLPALKKAGFERIGLLGQTKTPPFPLPSGVEWYEAPYEKGWGQRTVPTWIERTKSAIFFTPSGIPPLATKQKTAMTIHDLSFLKYPAAYDFKQRFRLAYLMKRAAKRADVILVPSVSTRHDVSHAWRIPLPKVQLTPLALPAYQTQEITKPEWVTFRRYFVTFGRIERKKNLAVVIRAFAAASLPDHHLVLAGSDGYGSEEITSLILDQPEHIRSRIHTPGYVIDSQKHWLISHAEAIIAASPHEGFGIPVLEAFHANIPLLCSRGGALEEVAGDAALFAQPNSLADWKDGLEKISGDRTLRAELRQRGARRFHDFSWSKTAALTAQALARTVEE